MQTPDPLSVDMARALLGIQYDTGLAEFLGVDPATISRYRNSPSKTLPKGQRAQVEAELLKRELAARRAGAAQG